MPCTTQWERTHKEWRVANCTWSVQARLCERKHLRNGFWGKRIIYSENRKTYPSFSFQWVIYGPQNTLHHSLSCYSFFWRFLSWRNKTSHCIWKVTPPGRNIWNKVCDVMKEDRRRKETGDHREMEKFEKSIGVKRSVVDNSIGAAALKVDYWELSPRCL